MTGADEIRFRRLGANDLSQLHHWLNEPGVVRWWEGDDVSWEGVLRNYRVDQVDSTEHWIASAAGEDVGWIQCWDVTDGEEDGGAAAMARGVTAPAGMEEAGQASP